jgi:predicted Na+-dependent transporter
VVLARQNFADPLVAIPSAISSLFHSLIASLLAALWRRRSALPVRTPAPSDAKRSSALARTEA